MCLHARHRADAVEGFSEACWRVTPQCVGKPLRVLHVHGYDSPTYRRRSAGRIASTKMSTIAALTLLFLECTVLFTTRPMPPLSPGSSRIRPQSLHGRTPPPLRPDFY